MTKVIYNELGGGIFFLSYSSMEKFNKLGYKYSADIPRHHPLLVHLYEKDKESLEGIGCSLNMKEIKGSVYTITSDHGYEEVKEPDEIKWVIVSS
jgi:hypothetical protein